MVRATVRRATVRRQWKAVQMFGISGLGNSFWIVGSDSLILHRR